MSDSERCELLKGLHAEPGIHEREWQVVNATGHRICYVQAFSEDEAIYLARSIVRALNSHEELLAVCQATYDYVTRDKTLTEFHSGLKLYAQLRGALDKAERG